MACPMSGTLHLAQAQSNRGRRGRKKDFPDAERLVKRLVADELVLSSVPDTEQRLWRVVTRRKYQLTRNHVRLQNQLEGLLEECMYRKIKNSFLQVDGFLEKVSTNEHVGEVGLFAGRSRRSSAHESA
jgi:hypothetical protein